MVHPIYTGKEKEVLGPLVRTDKNEGQAVKGCPPSLRRTS